MQDKQFLIIGAGLAGLAAAMKIESTGGHCILFDEASFIGGRLQTEIFEDAYLLDHGFQVLLPSYPALKEHVDLKALDLQYFKSGAILFNEGQRSRISDPLHDPLLLFETINSAVGTLKDKLLILKLKWAVLTTADETLLSQNLGSSVDFLRDFGFSNQMIENFWRPFFSGIFLEDQLQTKATFLKFLFKMFSSSAVAVPSKGIAELPKWMLRQLRNSEVLLNSRVVEVDSESITLANGKVFAGQVVDTRPALANHWGSVTTLYFSAPTSPIEGPWLMLNRKTKNSFINHLAVMSEVSKDYARNGDALISVSVIQPGLSAAEFSQVLEELQMMLGPVTKSFRFLKSFEIAKALPLYLPTNDNIEAIVTPSQQGAFERGFRLSS